MTFGKKCMSACLQNKVCENYTNYVRNGRTISELWTLTKVLKHKRP